MKRMAGRTGSHENDRGYRFLLEGAHLEEEGKVDAAAEQYRSGAKLGSRDCQLMLGFCYDEGKGVARDMNLALHWYRKAWHNGSAAAAGNIGTVLRDAGDLLGAIKWFKVAIDAGDIDSRLTLAQMLLRMARNELDFIPSDGDETTRYTQEQAKSLRDMLLPIAD